MTSRAQRALDREQAARARAALVFEHARDFAGAGRGVGHANGTRNRLAFEGGNALVAEVEVLRRGILGLTELQPVRRPRSAVGSRCTADCRDGRTSRGSRPRCAVRLAARCCRRARPAAGAVTSARTTCSGASPRGFRGGRLGRAAACAQPASNASHASLHGERDIVPLLSGVASVARCSVPVSRSRPCAAAGRYA